MAYDQNFIENLPTNLGTSPALEAKGDDTTIDMYLRTQGGGQILPQGSVLTLTTPHDTATAEPDQPAITFYANPAADPSKTPVNIIDYFPAEAGSGPTLRAVGTDANIDFNINPPGTGRLKENGTAVVLGATGSTDNALVRADGTGGKTVQGGTNMPTVDDSGNMTVGQNLTVSNTLLANGIVSLGAPALLTIATGAISVTKSYHRLATEAAAATDDLDTISGGTEGMLLTLRANNAARTIVVKHATGNIRLDGSVDFSLDNTLDTITLIYDDTLATWQEWGGRCNNGA